MIGIVTTEILSNHLLACGSCIPVGWRDETHKHLMMLQQCNHNDSDNIHILMFHSCT